MHYLDVWHQLSGWHLWLSSSNVMFSNVSWLLVIECCVSQRCPTQSQSLRGWLRNWDHCQGGMKKGAQTYVSGGWGDYAWGYNFRVITMCEKKDGMFLLIHAVHIRCDMKWWLYLSYLSFNFLLKLFFFFPAKRVSLSIYHTVVAEERQNSFLSHTFITTYLRLFALYYPHSILLNNFFSTIHFNNELIRTL